ncbi:DUF1987 domain-containing protein [Reichenbachiella agarivorans]|uniref:DUF1987 domain-containing protein n=1 Tax=Reichenbachiella agarivorans TaxID=2979464 RepID=A0ABY6CRN7_9BACT|nr:DUF1987 domain-containing protein [Reichenbachiella agarivorans]UXP33176.1 DUF1987 domain-containing protein [Reichenbachiella agarivorans]
MKGFFIRATRITPSIYFNPQKGLLDIRGKSSPENPLAFYKHIHESIDAFGNADTPSLTLNIAYEYFNTSSSKCIYILFKKVNDLRIDRGKTIKVNWYFEEGDEDMQEAGEDLSSFFNYEFNYVEIPEIHVLGEMKEEEK